MARAMDTSINIKVATDWQNIRTIGIAHPNFQRVIAFVYKIRNLQAESRISA